jgi:hypothetical protein
LIVAEGGNEQPFAFHVHAKVIQPPLDVWHGNGLDEPQRRRVLRARLDYQCSNRSQADCAESSHIIVFTFTRISVLLSELAPLYTQRRLLLMTTSDEPSQAPAAPVRSREGASAFWCRVGNSSNRPLSSKGARWSALSGRWLWRHRLRWCGPRTCSWSRPNKRGPERSATVLWASHQQMASQASLSDLQSAVECVKAGGMYVFVGPNDKIFQIANQDFAGLARHPFETVALTGELNGDTIIVAKIEVSAGSK